MVKRNRRPWLVAALAVAAVALASVFAAVGAKASPSPNAAGPAFGYVPSRDAHVKPHGRVTQLQYYGGPVQTSTANHNVYPIFWGPAWTGSFSSTASGIASTFYGGLGGSSYADTNTEYTDGSGSHVTSGATANGAKYDGAAAPSNAPTTSQVLAEVAKEYPAPSSAGAYYPVYSDQPRGSATYCAWHSTGTINGIRVEFAFFFSLSNDPGCSPDYPNASPQLEALGNVSGHEWSEMETDPQLNAWYDQQGNENADKCAWQFSGTQHFTNGSTWTIQGNWSNAASGCIWGT